MVQGPGAVKNGPRATGQCHLEKKLKISKKESIAHFYFVQKGTISRLRGSDSDGQNLFILTYYVFLSFLETTTTTYFY